MAGKIIVTYVGRFQPFHKGHYATYLNILKKFKGAEVYIGTSNKTDSEKSPFNFSEKKKIMTTMFAIPDNKIIEVKNPYRPIEILSKYNELDDVYITVVGEKDAERLGGKYFLPYTDNIEFRPYKEQGYVYKSPSLPNPISGTDVRKWLSGDIETAKTNFLKAYPKFNQTVFDLIYNKLTNVSEMAQTDMQAIEKFADNILTPVDIELGKESDHFFQRLNDPRNNKPISIPEMIGFFKRLAKNKKALVDFLKKYKEFVITDKRTNINVPFLNAADKLIAKTIMRKSNFLSPDPVLQIESKTNEKFYIDFLNKKKGFREDRIYFDGPNAYKDAVNWARKNLGKFSPDMIKIDEDITIPVNIGDTVLMGKFKNKRVTVKDISTDEHGMPTINGKKATTFRIPPEPISENESELKTLEKERDSLFLKALKTFPNSPTQLEIRKKLDSVMNKIKKIRIESITESLLLEGGAYGHMAHPFDVDMNLTFGDLKNIVTQALTGELELAREKTDGQALAISWKNGNLISARNKGHLMNAGEFAMSESDLISKFAGRGPLSDAFTYAIKDLKAAIEKLSESDKQSIFKEGKAFMNCEVIYPENTNVIPYGQSLLVFHGTMEYDERGNPISEDAKAGFKLAEMIKNVNANVQKRFSLQGPPIQSLPKDEQLSEKKPYYLGKISKLQQEFGLSDASGVQDYHQAWWSKWIDNNAPKKVSPAIKEGLIKRWAFFDKSFRMNQIDDLELREWADKTDKSDQQKISKTNLMKFEEIFLGVGADVLSFMKSVLTVNPDESKRQIIDKLNSTINTIRASGDAKSLMKLELELKRLESLGGFEKIVPNEGIVFNYKGNTYKLTGAFAPLNQILGIFAYSR